jgi:hypothetical protein
MHGADGEARRWRAEEAQPRMRAWEWSVDRYIGGRRQDLWRRPPPRGIRRPGGRRQDLWRRPPVTCRVGCHVGIVGANFDGATMR